MPPCICFLKHQKNPLPSLQLSTVSTPALRKKATRIDINQNLENQMNCSIAKVENGTNFTNTSHDLCLLLWSTSELKHAIRHTPGRKTTGRWSCYTSDFMPSRARKRTGNWSKTKCKAQQQKRKILAGYGEMCTVLGNKNWPEKSNTRSFQSSQRPLGCFQQDARSP